MRFQKSLRGHRMNGTKTVGFFFFFLSLFYCSFSCPFLFLFSFSFVVFFCLVLVVLFSIVRFRAAVSPPRGIRATVAERPLLLRPSFALRLCTTVYTTGGMFQQERSVD